MKPHPPSLGPNLCGTCVSLGDVEGDRVRQAQELAVLIATQWWHHSGRSWVLVT